MKKTEERLRDAVATVGDTLGPEDVPALRLPRRRRFLPSWRTALVATAASVAVVTAGAFFAIGSGGSGDRESVLGPAGSALTTPGGSDVTVFLCTKTSAARVCNRTDVTAAQRDVIKRELIALPEVRRLEFEARITAFERYRADSTRSPGFVQFAKEGDIPESFRLVLREPDDFRRVAEAIVGMPGVDQVVNENASAIPPR